MLDQKLMASLEVFGELSAVAEFFTGFKGDTFSISSFDAFITLALVFINRETVCAADFLRNTNTGLGTNTRLAFVFVSCRCGSRFSEFGPESSPISSNAISGVR